jgi:hypothetical protein
MHLNDPRFIFACLCWLGMLVIAFGAAVEIREKLTGNALSKVHFYVRMTSATCWLVSLGLMSFAVIARWPRAGDETAKHIFANILLMGLVFLVLAFLISFVDFVLFWRIRNAHRHQLANQMDQWIHQQIEEKQSESSEDKPSQSE